MKARWTVSPSTPVEKAIGYKFNVGTERTAPIAVDTYPLALRVAKLLNAPVLPEREGKLSAEDRIVEIIESHLSQFPPERRAALVRNAINAAMAVLNRRGGVAERSKAPGLNPGRRANRLAGSNPAPSANARPKRKAVRRG